MADQKKAFSWDEDDKAGAAGPAAGGSKKPFAWSDTDTAQPAGLSPENLAANKERNAQPTQFERENSGGVLDTANQLAGKALSAAGLPNSITDIPNWTAHLAGRARDSKPFWQPLMQPGIRREENIVGAVPLIGAPSVEMSRDVRAGLEPLDAAAALAGTIAAPFAAKEIIQDLEQQRRNWLNRSARPNKPHADHQRSCQGGCYGSRACPSSRCWGCRWRTRRSGDRR